jgi:hypothetical protein
MSKHEPVRILCVNTHVGQSLREGGFRRVRRQKKPNITMLQECGRVRVRARARLAHNPIFWINMGFVPQSDGPASSGTLIFAKRSRFKKIKGGSNNPLLTAAIPGDKWHPERRLTKLLVEDRKTGRLWRLIDVHTWTLGKPPPGMDAHIRREHKKQVDAYAGQLRTARQKNQAGVAAGDWNELVGQGSSYVESVMGSVGATSARLADPHRRSLDEVFVTPGVRVLAYEVIPRADLTTDHEGLYVELEA